MRDLGTLMVAKGFKNCPTKHNKSPNLVTLVSMYKFSLTQKSFAKFFIQTSWAEEEDDLHGSSNWMFSKSFYRFIGRLKFSVTIWDGFLKVQIICDWLGFSEIIVFKNWLMWLIFGQLFEKFGQALIPFFGRTTLNQP